MMAVARDIRGWEVDGNEISARSIEWAKEVFDVDIRYGLLEELDLPENWFDLVLFWHTLEHTIDVRETLLKTKDIMKPGGYLVIAVPRSESASSVERRYIPDHTHEFSEKALRLLLNKFGFIPLASKEPDGRLWTEEINVIYRLAENESNH